ncbi:PspC domain-containing protein [Sphingomicrobium clamense]|uniref:PspC domain-containing protein n=1 Tax=Sphingomicrobium clamense TaxID=2851013 RepID=A0ABS6V696_9SPHN|nr:PspC domain-containing protein [Sphingomicrobium sp. B8]MBW0145086.1 PspC domain-containing protein [Sphingomicrobium sp. B8]
MTTEKTPNIMMRNDTIFGVCEALGEDFGFNAQWLRVGFILPLFWFPVQMIALYFGLGLFVMISRMLFPTPAAKAAVPALPEQANEDGEDLPRAA